MGKIELTNLIIDDFSIAKRETNKIFTHILTHIHTGTPDHMQTTSRDSMMAGIMDPSTAHNSPNRCYCRSSPASPASYALPYAACPAPSNTHRHQDVQHPRGHHHLLRCQSLFRSSDGANLGLYGHHPLYGRHQVRPESV